MEDRVIEKEYSRTTNTHTFRRVITNGTLLNNQRKEIREERRDFVNGIGSFFHHGS